jgi:hypothetical protein
MRNALLAGMPSISLTDVARVRLETLSFFLLLFVASSLVVWRLWNGLRADFPRLPRLSYPKALGVVGLWGLLFLLVLTMISGARELMTPGAWKKDGLTYALDNGKPAGPTEDERRAKLSHLAAALAAHAAAHDGRYPASADDAVIPRAVWESAHASGMRFVYVPGRTAGDAGRVLAAEPELFGETRLVLLVGGEVRRTTSAELAALLPAGGRW